MDTDYEAALKHAAKLDEEYANRTPEEIHQDNVTVAAVIGLGVTVIVGIILIPEAYSRLKKKHQERKFNKKS